MRTALLIALLALGCGRRGIDAPRSVSVGGERVEPRTAVELRRGAHDLSLESATVLALESHPELAVRRLAPAVAGTFEAQQRAEFGATLYADGQVNREASLETNRATMMQFDVEGSRTTAQAGVRQRTPTGTEIDTSVGYRRDESNRSPEQQEMRVGISVTQSLLRGVDPEANLARVRQAELETTATEHQLRAFVTALLVELETAYWQLARARQRLAIHERSLELAEQEAETVEARISIGDLARADAPVVQAQVARRGQAVIDARAEAEAWRLRLARFLAIDPTHGTVTVDDEIAVTPREVDDAAPHRELALRLRPDLAEARARLEQARLETVVTGHGLLPRLDVFVQLAKTGFGSSFGDAFGGLGEPTWEITGGVSFEQLLGNDAASAENRRAELSREQAERAVENLETLVLLDVALALNELERARAQIDASARTAELLERVVAAERGRLEEGEGTALLVAQAEQQLIDAQITKIDAQIAYRTALIQLYAAEGSLLQRRGVELGA